MIDLAVEYQKYSIPREKKSHTGLDGLIHTLTGRFYKAMISPKRLLAQAEKIHVLSQQLSACSNGEMQQKIAQSKALFRLNRVRSEDELNQAVALVSEIACRTLGMRPHIVQLMGVLAQSRNFAVEMLPGEGKTITAAISGILAAWTGFPCHIVTSNDYLATRDAQIMEPLYSGCGVSVNSIHAEMTPEARRSAYTSMVVYATSKELLADFLRDQMKKDNFSLNQFLLEQLTGQYLFEEPVMRGLHTAIVDEADSVLADEATTPLIISVPTKNGLLKEASLIASNLTKRMLKDTHYTVYEKFREVILTEEGEHWLESHKSAFPEVWEIKTRREFLIRQALIAREFYHKHKQYIVDEEGKIVIVDEATGRLMPMRSWGAGLHQAIEAKENLVLTDPTETHTRMSFQRFFRLYSRLSGMSGTMQNLHSELWHIYKLSTIKIPKRVPNTYKLEPALIVATTDAKWQSVCENIKQIHPTGRPILVGTRSIDESELLASMLQSLGIQCTLLNALHHEKEAEIIARAGAVGSITIATNMAGRGTDILISDEVVKLGGLHVISTQRHESSRVDLQLYGRTARQGQPGTVIPILSLEDFILKQHCPPTLYSLLQKTVHTAPGRLLALMTYSWIQHRTEKVSSSVRKKILEKDFSLNDMLSFTSGK
ncbi:MAG: hypothetical protein H3C47_16395 [Candidatus Cloacimonetes bacterium]|nr:hypothetical protein [Candidatus Cloacimonadota bacterium]